MWRTKAQFVARIFGLESLSKYAKFMGGNFQKARRMNWGGWFENLLSFLKMDAPPHM